MKWGKRDRNNTHANCTINLFFKYTATYAPNAYFNKLLNGFYI